VREKISEYVPEMVEVLRTIALDPLEEGAVRVKAALGILDRGGLGPNARIEIERHDTTGLEGLSNEQLADKIESLTSFLRGAYEEAKEAAAAKRIAAREQLAYVDAEIVRHETTGADIGVPLEEAREVRAKLALVAGDGQ
jgi:hypothetical protein